MANQFSKVAEKFDELPDKLYEANVDGAEQASEWIKSDARMNLRANGNVYNRRVIQSLRTETHEDSGYSAEVSTLVGGREYKAKHALYLEYGTGSKNVGSGRFRFSAPSFGKNYIEALERWVRRKIGAANAKEKARAIAAVQSGLTGLPSGMHPGGGRRPTPYFKPAWYKTKPHISGLISKNINKELRSL